MYDDQKHLLSICWYHVRLKHLPAMRETQVRSLGWEDPLEKEVATHSSTLAWRIPRMGEPGGLPSMESHRVGHNWSDLAALAAAAVHKEANQWHRIEHLRNIPKTFGNLVPYFINSKIYTFPNFNISENSQHHTKEWDIIKRPVCLISSHMVGR